MLYKHIQKTPQLFHKHTQYTPQNTPPMLYKHTPFHTPKRTPKHTPKHTQNRPLMLYIAALMHFLFRKHSLHFNTQPNIFPILLNQTEIRLYLPIFPIDLEPANWTTSVCCSKSIRKMVCTIRFWFDSTRFGKDFRIHIYQYI